MKNKFHSFEIYNRRGKTIIVLLYLDIFILTLSLFATLTHISMLVTHCILTADLCLLLGSLFYLKKNNTLLYNIEDFLIRDKYKTTAFRIHQFHKLMNDNLFEYHFQPIIDARTGEIFAYEALMRTKSEKINMQPKEILDLAAKENCLSTLEKLTFSNVLNIMKEYSDVFSTRKLFINSIPAHQLEDGEFHQLYDALGPLFHNIVLEFVPLAPINDNNIQLARKRLQNTHCQLALDDYGTGYSNASNLLNISPNYVKIAPSILRHINIDIKKQQLVTTVINLASQYNIKVIAEGIESYDEFAFAINLGVDYVQGFYTARPNMELIRSIPKDILHKLQEINHSRLYNNKSKLIYETKGEDVLSPYTIALSEYSGIIIKEKNITFQGGQGKLADISLIVPNHCNCSIILDNVSLRGNGKPSIIIGKNCFVTITLMGDNYLTGMGIRVTESATLKIKGKGNLSINGEGANTIGIGGAIDQDYGNIFLDSKGSIQIKSKANKSVGIGGGKNSTNSLISITAGHIMVETLGYLSLGIGCVSGNSRIEITNCKLDIVTEGRKAISIGSLEGCVDIMMNAEINVMCDGKYCNGIGAIDDSNGTITIYGGTANIQFSSNTGSGIGSINGNVNTYILGGDISISGEGADIIGIGTQKGFGKIYINDGIISIILYAANAVPIGNVQRNVIIEGGNIQCDFPEDIIPVNSHQIPLAAHIITETDEFLQAIETIHYSYVYKAKHSTRFPYIKVYLPENILLP